MFKKAPNTYLIIFALLIITAALSWIIPGGEYDTVLKNGKNVVDANSFRYIESHPQGPMQILTAPIRGFVQAALIIGFVFLVGGVFSIFQKTEAVDSAIMGITHAYDKYDFLKPLLIPLFVTLFSLAGAVFGMSEEVIPFVLIFIPLFIRLGYDTITGIAVPFVGAGAGFAGAFLNPFTLGIAQGISEVPLFSGIEYRLVVWFVVTLVTVIFIVRYAEKIKKHPEKSITYAMDQERRKEIKKGEPESFSQLTTRHKIILIFFLAGLGVIIYGVLKLEWYIEEIAAVFLITGILIGIAGKLSGDEMVTAFISGAKDLTGTALIIGLARGILILAEDGKIISTVLYNLAGSIEHFHPIISSQVMYLVHICINFFVPSGSGQAALTMPVMAPLSDLIGVSRQTAVLAFQFGDGFTNMIIPTSAVTLSVLSLAKVPWEKWARWVLPLEIIFIVLALLLLIPPYFLQWH